MIYRTLLLLTVMLSLGGTCKGKEGAPPEEVATPAPNFTKTGESEADVQTTQETKPCQASLDKKTEAWAALKVAIIKNREAYVSYDFAMHKMYQRKLSGQLGLTVNDEDAENTGNAYLSSDEKRDEANNIYQGALRDYQNCTLGSSSVVLQEDESEDCQAAAEEWHWAWSEFQLLSYEAMDKADKAVNKAALKEDLRYRDPTRSYEGIDQAEKVAYQEALQEKDTAYNTLRLTLKVYQKCDCP